MVGLILAFIVSVTPTGPTHSDAPRSTSWRVAVVMYDSIEVVCDGRQVSAVLPAVEVEEAFAELTISAGLVDQWSDGSVAMTRIDAGTLTSADSLGSGTCWPAPANLQAMSDWPVGFDSVYVLHPNRLHGWGGLNWNCGACAFGSTYATQPIWDGAQQWFDGSEFGRHVFIHEWTNGVAGFYRAIFGPVQVPNLYADQSRYRFTSWYADFLGGRLREVSGGKAVGLTKQVWAYGTPSNHD